MTRNNTTIPCKTIVDKNTLFVNGPNTQLALTESPDYFLYMERLTGNIANITNQKNLKASRGVAKLRFSIDENNSINIPKLFEFSFQIFAESMGSVILVLEKDGFVIDEVITELKKGDLIENKISTAISSFDELKNIAVYLNVQTPIGKIGLKRAKAKVLTSKMYKTVLNPIHLSKPLSIRDACGILRTNSRYSNDVLEYFNSLNKPYFIHFLDGDDWGKRAALNRGNYIDKWDHKTSFDFFKISIYKDSVSQWVDEFIIISPEDLTEKIDEMLRTKDFTMTHLLTKVSKGTMSTISHLNKLMRKKKLIKKGVTYNVDL